MHCCLIIKKGVWIQSITDSRRANLSSQNPGVEGFTDAHLLCVGGTAPTGTNQCNLWSRLVGEYVAWSKDLPSALSPSRALQQTSETNVTLENLNLEWKFREHFGRGMCNRQLLGRQHTKSNNGLKYSNTEHRQCTKHVKNGNCKKLWQT